MLGFGGGLTRCIRYCLYVDDVYVLCMFAMEQFAIVVRRCARVKRSQGCSDVRRPGDVVDKTKERPSRSD